MCAIFHHVSHGHPVQAARETAIRERAAAAARELEFRRAYEAAQEDRGLDVTQEVPWPEEQLCWRAGVDRDPPVIRLKEVQ